jgi:hypothetical protein
MIRLLRDPQERSDFACRFRNRVEDQYSPRRIMRQICDVYDAVLQEGK